MVTWNTSITQKDQEQYGEKAAYLADLAQNGFSVPTFYTVDSDQVKAVIQDAADQDVLHRLHTADSWNAVQDAAATVRSQIQNTTLPEALQESLTAAYTDIGLSKAVRNANDEAKDLVAQRDFEFVAVRSTTTPRMPGINPAQLCVNGKDAVANMVTHVITQFYSDDAVYYRQRHDIDASAVMIQRMIAADASCTVHLADDYILVEAVPGLGTVLTRGSLTPDQYMLNPENNTVQQKTVAQKPFKQVQDPVTGRVTKQPVPDDEQSQPVFSRETLREIASMARKAASTLPVNQITVAYRGNKPHILGAAHATQPPLPSDDDSESQGRPAASGTGHGTPTDTQNSEETESVIYISEDSEPFYTPFLHHVNGIITRNGGVTSALAELCRREHIPFITAVQTDQFTAADQLSMDGGIGSITPTARDNPEDSTAETGAGTVQRPGPGMPATKIFAYNPAEPVDNIDGVLSTQQTTDPPQQQVTYWSTQPTQDGQVTVVNAATTKPSAAQGKAVLFHEFSSFQHIPMYTEHGAAAYILDLPTLRVKANDPSYIEEAVRYTVKHANSQEITAIVDTVSEDLFHMLVAAGVTTVAAPPDHIPRVRSQLTRVEKRFLLREIRQIQ